MAAASPVAGIFAFVLPQKQTALPVILMISVDD